MTILRFRELPHGEDRINFAVQQFEEAQTTRRIINSPFPSFLGVCTLFLSSKGAANRSRAAPLADQGSKTLAGPIW